MKIGKYIFEILPKNAMNIDLGLPYTNNIWYNLSKPLPYNPFQTHFGKSCKHIKPNTGERYEILGLYWKILIIKIIN
jgi:hypothetical protein